MGFAHTHPSGGAGSARLAVLWALPIPTLGVSQTNKKNEFTLTLFVCCAKCGRSIPSSTQIGISSLASLGPVYDLELDYILAFGLCPNPPEGKISPSGHPFFCSFCPESRVPPLGVVVVTPKGTTKKGVTSPFLNNVLMLNTKCRKLYYSPQLHTFVHLNLAPAHP